MTAQQFQVIAGLLIEIRDALSGEPAAEGEGCAHPDNARVSLATLADPEHWICRQCRYEYHGLMQH